MNYTKFKKIIIISLSIFMVAGNLNLFLLLDIAFAYEQPFYATPIPEPTVPDISTYNSLFGILTDNNNPAETSIYATTNGLSNIKIKGRDKASVDQITTAFNENELLGYEYIADNKPDLDKNVNYKSIIFNKTNFIFGADYALAATPTPDINTKKLDKFDIRIFQLLVYLNTKKTYGGEGEQYLEIAKWSQKDKLSKENSLADQNNDSNPISSHWDEAVRGVQVSRKDYIKCTQIQRDDSCQIVKKTPLDPIEIPFNAFTGNGSGIADPGNGLGVFQNDNFLRQIASTYHQFYKNIATGNFLNPVLESFMDLDSGSNVANLAKYAASGPTLAASVGLTKITQEYNLPLSIGYDLSSTITATGKETMAQAFNNVLPAESFVGDNQNSWVQNIGRETLSEKMFGDTGFISSKDSQTMLNDVGKRKFERILNLKQGILSQSTPANSNDLNILLGEGVIEQQFNLKLGSFAANNTQEIKNAVGEEKYNLLFTDTKIAANTLGIAESDLTNNINNPQALKRIVGEKLISQNVNSYGEYQIPGTNNFINSRDLAFDTENYLKPSIDLTNNKLTTYRYTPGVGIEKNEYSYDSQSNLYENLLFELQKNSLVRRFVSANDLDKVYKETGIDAVAKGLTFVDDEREILRQWLSNPNAGFPRTTDGYNIVDTAKIGTNVGLTDLYDISRIFVDNRGNEVFNRIGNLQLETALNPSASSVMSQNDPQMPDDSTIQFNSDKLDKIKNLANNLPNSIKNNVQTNVDQAKTANNNTNISKEDYVLNTTKATISQSLYNIGQAINANDITNTDNAQNIRQLINEIIVGQDIPAIKDMTNNLTSNLEIGMSQKDLSDFLNSNLDMNTLVQNAGKRTIATMLEIDNSSPDAIDNALKAINQAQQISSSYNSLKSSFDTFANNVNYALENKGNDLLNGWEMASVLNGLNNVLISKVTAPLSAYNLGISTNDFMNILRGQYNIANSTNINNILEKFGTDVDPQYSNALIALINSMGQSDFQSQILNIGRQFMPSITLSLPNNNNPALATIYNQINSNITALMNGQQIRPVFDQLKTVAGDIFGQYGIADLFRNNPIGFLQDYGIKGLNDFMQKQLGQSTSIEVLRWLNGMAQSPADVLKYVQEQFPQFLSNLTGGKYDNVVKALTNTFAYGQFSKEAAINQIAALLNQQDIGINQNVISNIINGNPEAAIQDYLTNYFSKAKVPYASDILQAIQSGNWNSLSSEAQNLFTSKVQDFFNAKGLPSGTASAIFDFVKTGNASSITSLLSQEAWKNLVDGSWDKYFKLSDDLAGSIRNLGNLMKQLNSGIQTVTGLLNNPVGTIQNILLNSKQLGELQNSINTLINNTLGKPLQQLSKTLGLITGTMNGLFGSLVSSIFTLNPMNFISNVINSYVSSWTTSLLTNLGFTGIASSLVGGIITGAITSILGGLLGIKDDKNQVWCAMDYYPYLDPEVKYDIPFEPTFNQIDNNGLENMKSIVGDEDLKANDGNYTNKCINLGPPPTETQTTEKHGLGEFKLDNKDKLNDKIKLAAKFKITQLVGELLRMSTKLDNTVLLPSQIRIADMDNDILSKYTGQIDRLYGVTKTNPQTGQLELVRSYKQTVLDKDTMMGVWSDTKYPNVYISY